MLGEFWGDRQPYLEKTAGEQHQMATERLIGRKIEINRGHFFVPHLVHLLTATKRCLSAMMTIGGFSPELRRLANQLAYSRNLRGVEGATRRSSSRPFMTHGRYFYAS